MDDSGTREQFTVERANRTLPLVRRIVEDTVAAFARWQERVQERELLAGTERADAPHARAVELEREAQRLAAEIEGYAAELRELGVELKSVETGLVDFPGEIAGRPVYLCWRLGEPAVQFWHERDAGYAGRQPLSPQGVT